MALPNTARSMLHHFCKGAVAQPHVVGFFRPYRFVDSDFDGYTDDRDCCPDLPEDFDGHADEDGCPDCDNDGDGVPEIGLLAVCPASVDYRWLAGPGCEADPSLADEVEFPPPR
ncbi:hypothetical protein OV203_24425 [Nannocystis sp. ILAH1]|uniref:hypothetical protein n=1 Tax=Nannocystis sp. ILAH1 TaxID=2996789 RepID=UPI00226FD339|nr:hypothetical protein [Nannocystis sp. ILAH1]MCY0990309.1 hypothetical protein [Nannocystis sp. ILAH1]